MKLTAFVLKAALIEACDRLDDDEDMPSLGFTERGDLFGAGWDWNGRLDAVERFAKHLLEVLEREGIVDNAGERT